MAGTSRNDGRRSARLAAVVVTVALLAGCGGGTEPERFAEASPRELYARAERLLGDKRYERAAKAFEEVERQHPFAPEAVEAQLMAAYAYYQNADYDAAIAAARRFVELHPGHEDVPYALYLIGQSWYERIEIVERDQTASREALRAFRELIRRFPDSEYAKDARLKIDLVLDHLAGKEMDVGRFYQQRKEYLAAVNRFRRVIEDYQTTSHVPEALYRLVESYLALGLPEEARKAAAVLGHNYPDSRWYRRAYALVTGGELPPEDRPRSVWSRLADLWPF